MRSIKLRPRLAVGVEGTGEANGAGIAEVAGRFERLPHFGCPSGQTSLHHGDQVIKQVGDVGDRRMLDLTSSRDIQRRYTKREPCP